MRHRWRTGAREIVIGLLPTALVVMLPAGALALDLTGQWTGKMTCKGVLVGQKQSFTTAPSTLLISQSGGLEISADGIFYVGEEIPDPTHPDRGEVAIIRCGTTANSGEFGGELGRLKATTKPAKRAGSLTGMSFRTDVIIASSVYTCRWTYKRVSTTPPMLEGCP